MSDYMIRGYNSEVRIVVARTTQTVAEAQRRHECSATAISALGRLMTGGYLLTSTLKGEKETLSLSIDCQGPLGKVVVDAAPTGFVRGYVLNPKADIPSQDGKAQISNAMGEGTLTVMRSLGNGESFNGTTPLVDGEIGTDITHYLLHSEQIPSLMSLGVLVAPDLSILASGGIFIQALPGASDETLEAIENTVLILPPISQMIHEGNTPEEIIRIIFGHLTHEIGVAQPVRFFCPCTKERMAKNLITLGQEELSSLAEDDETLELVCHFCNEHYYFTPNEIKELIETI